jgi:glucose-6-phosphate 1-dehydrogenase
MKLFVFGSTGDLFKRKVIKAIKDIKNLEIIALGRKNLTHEQYFEETCPTCDEEIKKRTMYLPISFLDKIQCIGCQDHFSKEEINYFYVALPPSKIIETLEYINSVKKTGHKVKVLIEKPFGASLEEAEKIKNFIEEENFEEDIFLADHYLFKENIRNIEHTNFRELKIVSLEKIGVEKRAFYDDVGAVNDMVQSHLLNVLIKIIGFEKINSLIVKEVKFGQYKSYSEEIEKKSNTETYAKIKLEFNDCEIEIKTGKNFPKKENYIEIDDKKTEVDSGKEAYLQMLEDFLDNKREKFPSIEQAIRCWKLVNKIKEFKSELEYY